MYFSREHAKFMSFQDVLGCAAYEISHVIYSPWAETPKIGFFVPIGGTSAIMDFLNLHLLMFMKIHDINTESVAFLVK